MNEFEKLDNDELLKMMSTISNNHQKVKEEIVILHEVLINLEKDYIAISEIVKNRK